MADDDDAIDREAILRRRAVFVASALAGVALSGCEAPRPCLSVAHPPPPDSGSAAASPSASAPPEPPARPQPCLEIARPPPSDTGSAPKPPPSPPPEPCLKIAPRRAK